jgi:antitoxin HicB
MAISYPVVIDKSNKGIVIASVPDVQGTISYGPDESSAVRNVREALTAILSSLVEDREEIPPPSRVKRGQPVVVVPPMVAAKIVLYRAMREQGLTQEDLARRLDCNARQVRRLLDPAHRSRFDLLEKALACVGKQIVFDFTDLAA